MLKVDLSGLDRMKRYEVWDALQARYPGHIFIGHPKDPRQDLRWLEVLKDEIPF